MFHVVLHSPQIPPNTGNVIRLAANVGFHLHLIEPLGFDLQAKQLRRAGLDYRDLSHVTRHVDFATFVATLQPTQIYAITTKGTQSYADIQFKSGDVLLFGSETQGLPNSVMETIAPAARLRIPMQANNRSLNLSNSVAIVAYEAWRQLAFDGGN